MLGEALGLVIAHPGADVAAGTGQDAHNQAQHGRADKVGDQHLHLLLCGEEAAFQLCRIQNLVRSLADIFRLNQHLRQREEADQGRHGLNAALQRRKAIVKAGGAVHDVIAHQRQSQTEHAGNQALQQVVGSQRADDGQAEHRQQEIFGGIESQGEAGQRGCNHQQQNAADGAADHGAHRGHTDCPKSLAPQGQLIAVHCGGRGAGGMKQNCGYGAAVDGGGINGRQHNQSRHRFHAVGHGNQNGNAHGGAQSGKCADHDTAAHAHCQSQQGL